jgi:hypothetical protein
MTSIEVLTKSFKLLPEKNLRLLKGHLEKGTPIFCGPGSNISYYSYEGLA